MVDTNSCKGIVKKTAHRKLVPTGDDVYARNRAALVSPSIDAVVSRNSGLASYKRHWKLTTAMVHATSVGVVGLGLGIGGLPPLHNQAYAQAVPAGCTTAGVTADNIAESGETVTCVAPPSPIDGIATTVSDLTINIGNAGVPTSVVNNSGDGVNQSGGGNQTLNINDIGSSVFGSNDGAEITVSLGGGSLNLTSEGSISGNDNGIYARNAGVGGATLNVAAVTGDTDGDGNGSGIYALNNYTSTGDLSITASGAVVGGTDGILTGNFGTGGLTLDVAAVTGDADGDGSGHGVDARNYAASTGDLSITASGTVVGGTEGISARNLGTGGLTLDVAAVTGDADGNDYGRGIRAQNYAASTGDLSITASGTVVGGTDGIYVINQGTGGLTLDVVGVTGDADGNDFGRGIAAGNNNTASTGDLSITASGAVAGAFEGILAINQGTGGLTLDVAGVTGDTDSNGFGRGIAAQNNNTASTGDLSITASGAVAGGSYGILAINQGTGGLTLDVAAVTGDTNGNGIGHGIYAQNNNTASAGDLSITASGAVAGAADGIYARNEGTGGLTLDVAAVTGDTDGNGVGNGIYAQSNNTASTGDLSITASGAVAGGSYGILAINQGTGGLTLDVAAVTGDANGDGNGHGIDAQSNNTASTGDLSITASDAVAGGADGIYARNEGTGGLTLDVAAVTGDTDGNGVGNGIYAQSNNTASTGDLSITASGAVAGGADGIYARNEGTGGLTLDVAAVTGDTDGNGVGNGIDAQNNNAASTGDLSITASGAVAGGADGIYARNEGTGALTLDVAAVTGDANGDGNGHGIDAQSNNTASTGDLSITASDAVAGGSYGIYALKSGSGGLTLDVAAVTGDADGNGSGSGIFARINAASTGDLSITASGTVAGGNNGIYARNSGSGGLTLDVAAVTGDADGNGFGRGIQARNAAASTSDLSITASGTVVGGTEGISARNFGTGGLTLDVAAVTGDADGDGSGRGIYARTEVASMGDLSITASGTVAGGLDGIFAMNLGRGELTLDVAGVTGDTDGGGNGYGIYALNNNASNTGDLSITASGAVAGAFDGIFARNEGRGGLILDVAGVTGDTDGNDIGNGIYAQNNNAASTGDLSITASGAVAGGADGIYARNSGTGGLTLDVAAVTGDADGNGIGHGIYAQNNTTSAGDLSITASGTVVGGTDGISARNYGTRGLMLNVAAVTGDSNGNGIGYGIDARNLSFFSTDVSITASGAVAGGYNGIRALNFGTGGVTLNVAAVTGDTDGDGIGRGINASIANSSSTGDLSITASGTVAAGYDGIIVSNSGMGGVTLNVAAVTGDADGNGVGRGINAQIINPSSTGDLSITASSAVTGGNDGIYARNSGMGGMTLNVAAVTGDADGNGVGRGINAQIINPSSTGDLSITASSAVTGGDDGIYARNYGSGGLTLDVAAVTGDADGNAVGDGIVVNNAGLNPTNVTANGDVSGVTGINILERANMVATTITTASSVTGTGGTAINLQGDGNDVVNINGGSVITGSIDFGNGNDGMGGTNPNDIDTLNVGPGFNGVITFADAGGAGQGDTDLQSAPENINGPVVLINNGLAVSTAIAVDPSGFAASGAFLGSITNSILNTIENNGSTPENELSTYGGSGSYEYGTEPRFWFSGFGGHQDVSAGSNNAALDHDFAGLMFGTENDFGDGTAGFLIGYGVSDVDVAFSAGRTEVESLFGGGYWKRDYGTHRIHLAFLGGTADHKFTRNIFTGAVPTTANGDADGWFISSSATIAAPVEVLPTPAVASLRVDYSGLFLNGYTETGTVAIPLTVSSRDVHLLNGRAQIAFPHYIANDDGSHSHFELRTGLEGQVDLGSSNVTVAQGATAINFQASLDDDVSGFVGASLTHNNPEETFAITISGELESSFEGSFGTTGEINASWKF